MYYFSVFLVCSESPRCDTQRAMDVLAIKKNARLERSEVASIECIIYQKHGMFWYCPDPLDREESTRLERELDEEKWGGKVTRWITHEEYLLWSFQSQK